MPKRKEYKCSTCSQYLNTKSFGCINHMTTRNKVCPSGQFRSYKKNHLTCNFLESLIVGFCLSTSNLLGGAFFINVSSTSKAIKNFSHILWNCLKPEIAMSILINSKFVTNRIWELQRNTSFPVLTSYLSGNASILHVTSSITLLHSFPSRDDNRLAIFSLLQIITMYTHKLLFFFLFFVVLLLDLISSLSLLVAGILLGQRTIEEQH